VKALIVYGTRYGSTAETSEEIAKTLRARGVEVDVVNAKKDKVRKLDDYDLFIVGSGIRMGKWTGEPLKFLRRNEEALSSKPVALFVSCASAGDPNACEEGRAKYLDAVGSRYPRLRIISKGLFGGKYDSSAGFMMKMAMRGMREELEKKGLNPDEPYDFRDWDAIRAWAAGQEVAVPTTITEFEPFSLAGRQRIHPPALRQAREGSTAHQGGWQSAV
jgi:menaquinone-dependent protoporphyrinogen oxidase